MIIGVGAAPSIVLAVGTRPESARGRYPVSELAAKHGASAPEDTTDPREAYAAFDRSQPGRPDGWDDLPWA